MRRPRADHSRERQRMLFWPQRWKRLTAWLSAPASRRAVRSCVAVQLVLTATLVAIYRPKAGLALNWMLIYLPQDFTPLGWGEIGRFFLELRTGIPPAIAFLEILSQKLFSTTAPVSVGLYRAGLGIAFTLPLLMFGKTRLKLAMSQAFCAIFVFGTLLIHPGNPQVYDVWFPTFVLLWLFALDRSRRAAEGRGVWSAAAAGFFLSMAELSRPVFILLLPIHLLVAVRTGISRAAMVALLLPLAVISGGWHAKLLLISGQVVWSNHGGFHLERAWPIPDDLRKLTVIQDESYRPVRAGRWNNLNTESHYRNSQRLASAILRYYLERPRLAWLRLWENARMMLRPQTGIYFHQPRHRILDAYTIAVRLAIALAMLSGATLLWRLIRRPKVESAMPENLLTGTALAMLALFILSDSGEQARFMISLLPLFAAEPWRLGLGRDRQRAGSLRGEDRPLPAT
jgi:hypothetical protein